METDQIITPAYVAEIHREATGFGAGKLSGRERDFIESIYRQSQNPWFRGLTSKQASWFRKLAGELERTKGMTGFEVIAMQLQARRPRQNGSDAYHVACIGR